MRYFYTPTGTGMHFIYVYICYIMGLKKVSLQRYVCAYVQNIETSKIQIYRGKINLKQPEYDS